MEFVQWLMDRITSFENPIAIIIWIIVVIGLLVGLISNPLTTVAGCLLWINLMYNLYKRE